ncbi:MAG TPA: sigma-70 family RNA polymerase sigma factor [Acidobacteriaceae bacterium]|jgi:RNA polymerase sigma-70 factor (ECF subfamily)|nr:sigma-70 family RNA polymerase sigma factor [Acidobacteriaceae bacterium]
MRSQLEDAIHLLKSGDPASAERALELLRQTVLSFGIRVCGHREDAEDTAQEVLIRALPHLAKLEDPRALSAWLYTAAKNRCWQGRRTDAWQKTIALEQLLPADAELESLLLRDPSAGPEEQALDRQDHRLLHQAVLALPPQYRIVLVLHDMEELDSDLVAKILSLQPGTVRVRLHRARLLVRQEMARLLQRAPEKQRRRKPLPRRSAQCREIFANLSDYLDGRLEPESCERMRSHIEACPACVAFIEDLKRAIDRCRALDVRPQEETEPALRRLLTEEYLRLKNSADNL